ncbi:MAG: heparan-alpha-glucosaminide N-acetyltransferase domain-containing protein [Pseudomonadota bacterium]
MGTTARLPAIDMLRGLVIALMALDHTRDFFGFAPFHPEDLSATTPAWFWTRWFTHLCATAFVLLAGCSAFLRGEKNGVRDLSRYLATRGAMLIALEATWVSFSWQFGYGVIIFQVIWALGMSMIVLAGLVWLPRPAIALFAALLIVGHNAFDGWRPGGLLAQALHQGGFYPVARGFGILFVYPLLPWPGLMAAGYALGPIFNVDAARRRRLLLLASGALMLTFIALRLGNLYGDPDPWSAQGRGFMFDLMSFVRVHKYPPSLQYLCVTGSIVLALLAGFERVRKVGVLLVFGRSPLFFYLLHIALIHLLAGVYLLLRYGSLPDVVNNSTQMPAGYTPSLALVYIAWLGILVLMYGLTLLCLRWRRKRNSASA